MGTANFRETVKANMLIKCVKKLLVMWKIAITDIQDLASFTENMEDANLVNGVFISMIGIQ